jgi:hypothetical protein
MSNDFTLDEKMSFAAVRAKEEEAEKHFFDLNQPHFPLGFSIFQRNPGHWDVVANQCPGKASAWLSVDPEGRKTSARDGQNERAFRVRGEPGKVLVADERWDPHRPHPRDWREFRSVMAAMVWICEELMQEPTPRRDNAATE